MKAPKTLQDSILYFANADNCVKYLADSRWPNGVECPTCGRKDACWLANQRKWQCKSVHAKRQFSVKVGTIFEDSPLGLEKWLPAVWMIAGAKNGISSYEIHRALGITQKTAWFMLHRIREAMKNGSLLRIGGNEGEPVEVDETFVGGKAKNMHIEKRSRAQSRGQHTDKPVVFGMLERGTRQVRAKVIPNVRREVLRNEILDNVMHGSKVFTHGYKGYVGLAAEQFIHETVSHINEYVRGEVHTQGIENFWSLLKRALGGAYVAVEPFHPDRYVSEQVFRFNNRATKDNPLTDADRFIAVLSQSRWQAPYLCGGNRQGWGNRELRLGV
jgi:transposase-like protein